MPSFRAVTMGSCSCSQCEIRRGAQLLSAVCGFPAVMGVQAVMLVRSRLSKYVPLALDAPADSSRGPHSRCHTSTAAAGIVHLRVSTAAHNTCTEFGTHHIRTRVDVEGSHAHACGVQRGNGKAVRGFTAVRGGVVGHLHTTIRLVRSHSPWHLPSILWLPPTTAYRW